MSCKRQTDLLQAERQKRFRTTVTLVESKHEMTTTVNRLYVERICNEFTLDKNKVYKVVLPLLDNRDDADGMRQALNELVHKLIPFFESARVAIPVTIVNYLMDWYEDSGRSEEELNEILSSEFRKIQSFVTARDVKSHIARETEMMLETFLSMDTNQRIEFERRGNIFNETIGETVRAIARHVIHPDVNRIYRFWFKLVTCEK